MPSEHRDINDLTYLFSTASEEIRAKKRKSLSDQAVEPLLAAWWAYLDTVAHNPLDETVMRVIRDEASRAVDAVSSFKAAPAGQQQTGAFWTILEGLDQSLRGTREQYKDRPEIADDLARGVEPSIARARDLWVTLLHIQDQTGDLQDAVANATKAASQAQAALAEAKKVVSEGATGQLEQSFEATARENAAVANGFRVATLVLLAVTVVVGGWFAVAHTPAPDEQIDWYGVIYRLAILSGLAAIATYLGRQAAAHRRIAVWAQGIQIQLKAFLNFVNEIEDPEARQSMFGLFGKRVLEAPPDGKSTSDESVTNVIQPIIEHVTKVRPPSSS